MTTSEKPRIPEPINPADEPHLCGLFAPQISEVDAHDLSIEGELPDLEGEYVRNGPNPRFAPLGGYLYPLDGDGMLHRVQLRGGTARYTNRFVRTPALRAEEAAGRALWPGITDLMYTPGPELVGPALAHTMKDLPGINVIRHGGKLLALAESASPFLLSPDLATLGRKTFGDTLPIGITAHPKVDPLNGELVATCYSLDEPYLTWSVIAKDGTVVRAATPVEGVDRSTMVHDMALTPNYVVLLLGPFFFDLEAAFKGGSPMAWQPEHGTRIVLIPRDGSPVRIVTTETFWSWHGANAYELSEPDGRTRVVLDYVRWSAPGGLVDGPNSGSLAQLRLDPAAGSVEHVTLVDRNMEFPRVDDRRLTQRHSVIGTALKTSQRVLEVGDADSLGWFDTDSEEFEVWQAGNLAVGEQTYIPKPGSDDSREGWWTTFATDRTTGQSQLLIIPAADPTSGPVAKVLLPQRVPLGLHGAWLPAGD